MQISMVRSLLLLFVASSEVADARLMARSFESSGRSELDALATVEADDRRFWSGMFSGLETQLESLRDTAAGVPAANATTNVTKNASKSTALAANNVTKEPSRNGTLAAHEKHANPLKGLKLNLNPKSVADLVPALEMLKGLYAEGKERISALNTREKQMKEQYEKKLAEHKAKLARIEERFKNKGLSAEFRANETRDENRMWKYWDGVRKRQHRQFHTSLKIQHGTMERVKTMMDMYEKTISGKADKQKIAHQLAKVGGGMPEIVFLQEAWRDLGSFCGQALIELRDTRQLAELDAMQHVSWRMRS